MTPADLLTPEARTLLNHCPGIGSAMDAARQIAEAAPPARRLDTQWAAMETWRRMTEPRDRLPTRFEWQYHGSESGRWLCWSKTHGPMLGWLLPLTGGAWSFNRGDALPLIPGAEIYRCRPLSDTGTPTPWREQTDGEPTP